MKLLKLHINNFGTLSNFDYSFTSGINEIIENNGTGKTTLTSFISAMFYGLETTKKNDADFKDRIHYLPFTGGTFGGSIDIEVNDKKYHIERTFSSKSSTDDTYRFTDEFNRDIDLGSFSTIGEYLFNVNKNTFLSTIFLGTNRIRIEMSTDISSKLNNLIDVSSTKNQYDKTINKVQSNIKEKEKTIAEIQKENIKLNNDIISIDEALKNEALLLNELETKNQELSSISSKLTNLYKNTDLLKKYNEYNGYKDRQKEIMSSIKIIENKYPGGILSKEEINTIKDNIDSMKGIKSITIFTPSENTEYTYLSDMFNNIIFDDIVLESLRDKYTNYNAKTNEIENLNNKIDKNILDKFSNTDLTIAYIEQVYEPKLSRYLELSDSKSKTNKDKIKPIEKALNIIAIVLCSLSIILFFFKYHIFGIISIVLGLGLFIFNIINILKRNKTIIEKERIEQETLLIELKDILKDYGYKTDHFKDNLSLLKDDLMVYEGYSSILSRLDDAKEELNQKKDEITDILKETKVDFITYINNPNKFETDAILLRKYNQRKEELNSTEAVNFNKKEELEKSIKDILSLHSIDYPQDFNSFINVLTTDSINLDLYNNEFNKLSKDICKLETENDFTDVKNYDSSLIDSLRIDETNIKNQINVVKNKLDDIDLNRDKKDEINLSIKSNELRIEEINKELNIVKLVLKSLMNANTSLIERYIEPIKNNYEKYTTKLSKILSSNPTIDENLNVTFSRDGMNRNMKHLSSGEQTLLDLSLRLSLIDTMYKTEKPFVILDDPFVFLDEEKISLTKDLIEEITGDKQILYLTCHKSRSLK